jgi:hypothetical protein
VSRRPDTDTYAEAAEARVHFAYAKWASFGLFQRSAKKNERETPGIQRLARSAAAAAELAGAVVGAGGRGHAVVVPIDTGDTVNVMHLIPTVSGRTARAGGRRDTAQRLTLKILCDEEGRKKSQRTGNRASSYV